MKQILTFLTLLFLIAACETMPTIPFDSSTPPRGFTPVKKPPLLANNWL